MTLFEPLSSDMRIDYPELNNYPEFRELSSNELKFVWLWSNRTSPYFNLGNNRSKASTCISESFGTDMPHDLKLKYLAVNFPKHVEEACKVMERFSPDIRSKAKMFTETVFKNMQMLGAVTQEELEKMDWDTKKKYTDLSLKIISELPAVIEKYEHGFGIGKTKKKTKTKSSASLMDIVTDLSDD